MICKLCGKESSDDALYCSGCGNSFRSEEEIVAEYEQIQSENISSEQDVTEPAVEEAMAEPSAVAEEPEVLRWPAKIKSHMVLAVVTTVIFFNWILGIPAIVFARECELAAEQGQLEIAMRFSRRAITFALVGVVLNIAIAAFLALVIVVMYAAGPAIRF